MLTKFVRETVSTKVSLLATDEHGAATADSERLSAPTFITALCRQYVVGAVHTNTIEGFWSHLQAGVVGTFHKVSAKYLPLYVAEFSSATTIATTTISSGRP